MKNIFLDFFIVVLFAFLPFEVSAMDSKFRGSAEEVKKELESIFPRGTHKTEVIFIATSKLGIDAKDIRSQNYGESPLKLNREGEEISIYSWIEMKIAEYRSVKKLFIRTAVVAKIFFDRNDKLIDLEVNLYGDSL